MYKLGRLPNDPSKPRLNLAPLLTAAAPTYPENKDWLSAVANWPMYLNDNIGDCTCAAAGHMIQAFTTYGQGQTVTITDDDVLAAYEAVSGYNPQTGENDNGAVMQDVLNFWRTAGIGRHKILAFAEVDTHNEDELRAALNLFGTLYLGINFPDTAMDQFNEGKPWDVAPNATNEGGHAINAGYYDVSDRMWKVVTWGQVQPMTQEFFDTYVEEAWVVVSEEWLNKEGNNPDGINMSALGEQFTALTGELSPFPAAPPPEPSPEPVPTSDEAFVEVARAWLGRNPRFYKHFQKELAAWLETK